MQKQNESLKMKILMKTKNCTPQLMEIQFLLYLTSI